MMEGAEAKSGSEIVAVLDRLERKLGQLQKVDAILREKLAPVLHPNEPASVGSGNRPENPPRSELANRLASYEMILNEITVELDILVGRIDL